MADIFNKWKRGLERTRKVAFGRISTMFGATEISTETWDELEALLIQADLGIETTQGIIKDLILLVDHEGITKTSDLQDLLKSEMVKLLIDPPKVDFSSYQPAVILVVGVNGSGKTTTLAKLGKQNKEIGKKIVFAAGDTFRAAAVEQLRVWGERLDIPVISGQDGSDPGAVVFDAIQAGISRKVDLIFIDTAGRLAYSI